jgi:hypothetical protein
VLGVVGWVPLAVEDDDLREIKGGDVLDAGRVDAES